MLSTSHSVSVTTKSGAVSGQTHFVDQFDPCPQNGAAAPFHFDFAGQHLRRDPAFVAGLGIAPDEPHRRHALGQRQLRDRSERPRKQSFIHRGGGIHQHDKRMPGIFFRQGQTPGARNVRRRGLPARGEGVTAQGFVLRKHAVSPLHEPHIP